MYERDTKDNLSYFICYFCELMIRTRDTNTTRGPNNRDLIQGLG